MKLELKFTPKPESNQFFDINKLPAEKGLLIFGLSMSKLSNRQNAENCMNDIRHLATNKISKPLVGLNFIYSDFLYLYSNRPAPELKHSFMNQIIDHRNSMQKLIEKNQMDFQIQHAFNYMVWSQLYVGTKDFNSKFEELKSLYRIDEKLQKYVKEDCDAFHKEMEENQINFFLEEVLVMYLLSKNQIKIPNDFIEGNQKWILWCYPGRPLKCEIYLHKLNPFKLDWPENPYQSCQYDLEAKQLIDFNRVDLETYEVR
jgi:hypothetical protein